MLRQSHWGRRAASLALATRDAPARTSYSLLGVPCCCHSSRYGLVVRVFGYHTPESPLPAACSHGSSHQPAAFAAAAPVAAAAAAGRAWFEQQALVRHNRASNQMQTEESKSNDHQPLSEAPYVLVLKLLNLADRQISS